MKTCHQSIETKLHNYYASIQPLSFLVQRLYTDGVDMRTRLTLEHGGSELTVQPISPTRVRTTGTSASNKETAEPPLRIGEAVVEQYRIQPWVNMVTQLWEEYDKGIPSGIGMPRGPSIKELNEKYDTKWRRDEAF